MCFLFVVSTASMPMLRPMNMDSTGNPGMTGAFSLFVVVCFVVAVVLVVMGDVVDVV